MEIRIVKDKEIKLIIDGNEGIDIESVDSEILENFVEACLVNNAIFKVDPEVESPPLAKLFQSLYIIKDTDNEFNMQIKNLEDEIKESLSKINKIKKEIDEDDLPF